MKSGVWHLKLFIIYFPWPCILQTPAPFISNVTWIDMGPQDQDKPGMICRIVSLHLSATTSSASFREHNPALWQPPRCPTHDRAGERQDRLGPQPGGEQGPLSHECVCGGNRPQRGSRQRRAYDCWGWAAGGELCIDCISELISQFVNAFLLFSFLYHHMFTLGDEVHVTEHFVYCVRSMDRSFMVTVTRMHPP